MLIHTDLGTVGRRAQEKLQAAADRTGSRRGRRRRLGRPARRREDEDEALAAYNDRLAQLASGAARRGGTDERDRHPEPISDAPVDAPSGSASWWRPATSTARTRGG